MEVEIFGKISKEKCANKNIAYFYSLVRALELQRNLFRKKLLGANGGFCSK